MGAGFGRVALVVVQRASEDPESWVQPVLHELHCAVKSSTQSREERRRGSGRALVELREVGGMQREVWAAGNAPRATSGARIWTARVLGSRLLAKASRNG